MFTELTAPGKRRPTQRGRKPACTRARKEGDDDKPTTEEVVGTMILKLGRWIRGEPKPPKAAPSTRRIVPKATATVNRITLERAKCGAEYRGDIVRLKNGGAVCVDCGESVPCGLRSRGMHGGMTPGSGQER